MRDGIYPPDPAGTGYIDIPIKKKNVKARAHFVTATEIATEVDARLEHCGVDGLLVEANYTWGRSIESLVKLAVGIGESLFFYDITKRISRALNYISSGRNRRWHRTKKREPVTYGEWVSHRRGKTSQSKAKCDIKTST